MILKNTQKEEVRVEIIIDMVSINGEQASIKVDEQEGLIMLKTFEHEVQVSTAMFFALLYNQRGSRTMTESHIGLVEAIYLQRRQHQKDIEKWLERCQHPLAIGEQFCTWSDESGHCQNMTRHAMYAPYPEDQAYFIMQP